MFDCLIIGVDFSHPNLIDSAIETILKKHRETPLGSLTAQDLFYVKVTRIHELFKVLAEYGDELACREQSSSKVSQKLVDIDTIVLTMLREVIKFRESKASTYALPAEKQNKYEYLPWTAATGSGGIRDALLSLINATLKHGIRSTGEPELRQRHYKNLVELIDFVLDGRRAYLESIKDQSKYNGSLQQYESQRSELIFNFGKQPTPPV